MGLYMIESSLNQNQVVIPEPFYVKKCCKNCAVSKYSEMFQSAHQILDFGSSIARAATTLLDIATVRPK